MEINVKKYKVTKLSRRKLISTICKIVEKHGRVRLVSRDAHWEPPCSCMCKACKKKYKDEIYTEDEPDMRRRIIDAKGRCIVSYRSDGYRSWSGYDESCFMDEYENNYDGPMKEDPDDYWGRQVPANLKYSVRQTLKYLLEHDTNPESLKMIRIEYGKYFKKVIYLEKPTY